MSVHGKGTMRSPPAEENGSDRQVNREASYGVRVTRASRGAINGRLGQGVRAQRVAALDRTTDVC